MVDITALFKLSYGIYLITSHDGEDKAGCLVNTVFQLTAEPVKVGVSVAKANATHDMIVKSGTVGISVVGESAETKLLGKFGYRSSRDIDKFADTKYHLDSNGDALIDEGTICQLSCKVENIVDMGTHSFFVCEVTEAIKMSDAPAMTYQYFRDVKKGQSSKYAPTYVDPVKLAKMKKGE